MKNFQLKTAILISKSIFFISLIGICIVSFNSCKKEAIQPEKKPVITIMVKTSGANPLYHN